MRVRVNKRAPRTKTDHDELKHSESFLGQPTVQVLELTYEKT